MNRFAIRWFRTILKENYAAVLKTGHKIRYRRARGGSMLPLIRETDFLGIDLYPKDVQIGDIVVINIKGIKIVHRLVNISFARQTSAVILLTKGDNKPCLDPPVPLSNLLGRVVTISNEKGTINLTTSSWRWLGWVIWLISFIEAMLFYLSYKLRLCRRCTWLFMPVVISRKGVKIFLKGFIIAVRTLAQSSLTTADLCHHL